MPKAEEVQKTAEDFAKAYNKLCEEYGFQIQAVPQWVPRDDGSFSLVVNMTVVEVQKSK